MPLIEQSQYETLQDHRNAWIIGTLDWWSVFEQAHHLFHRQRARPAVSGILRCKVHVMVRDRDKQQASAECGSSWGMI